MASRFHPTSFTFFDRHEISTTDRIDFIKKAYVNLKRGNFADEFDPDVNEYLNVFDWAATGDYDYWDTLYFTRDPEPDLDYNPDDIDQLIIAMELSFPFLGKKKKIMQDEEYSSAFI